MLHDQKWISTTSEILWNIKEKDILSASPKKWLRKIFHKKPDPCDGCDMAMLTSWISCDTCVDGCNKRKATEKELDDFMKYRGSLMGKE